MSKRINSLKEQYEKVVSEYIGAFSQKHGLRFEFWVADQVGGVACFGDILFFNFQDIVWDINSKQPKHLIVNWIYESVENPDKSICYYSYSKGWRWGD